MSFDISWINATSAGDDAELELDVTVEVNPVLVLVVLVCLSAALSQIVIMLIARGLEGDFSARTFMWVHALAQTCQQLAVLYMAAANGAGKFFLSFRATFSGDFN